MDASYLKIISQLKKIQRFSNLTEPQKCQLYDLKKALKKIFLNKTNLYES